MFVTTSNELLPNVRRDLFLLATCYVSHCYLLGKFNRRSVRLFSFEEDYKFQYVIATTCKKSKKLGLPRANFPIFFVIRRSLRSLNNR